MPKQVKAKTHRQTRYLALWKLVVLLTSSLPSLMHWVKLTLVCRHNFCVYSWVAGHSSLVSQAFDLKIFARFTFMKMFFSTLASRVFLPSKHITGHFSMNSFIFQIVVLWSSTLFFHKQNSVSSFLLSVFFQGPLRFTDLLRFLVLQ